MINRTQFDTLAAATNDYSISIYLPTYRVGNRQEDRIRLKNALKKAREKLVHRYDLRESQAEEFLAAGYELESNGAIWSNLSDGLAIFIGPDRFDYYVCPIDFEPMVYVAPEYYLRPLLPLLGTENRFHILALSKGAIKLYTANRYSISEVDLQGLVPVNMDAALLQDSFDSGRSRAGGPEGSRGGNNQAYFDRGGEQSNDVEEVKTYLDRVDKGIADYLCDDKAPLLLGGVEELIPIYQEANTYAHLYRDGFVAGNLEETNIAMIHERAWSVIGKHFDEQRDRDRKLYGDNLARREAGTDIHDIVPAAINGRVAALWLDRNRYTYGAYRADTNDVKVMTDEDKNATELFNLAAVRAFQSGARVYNVAVEELPADEGGLCAIYRYTLDADPTNSESN
ncbi:hypothetical protein GGR28_001008 [Lewinella aquimaris]|uniref:Uncharacterized protein n=1 Tax=Neolewinella aquimaris TaxID=1835722 RepID=A0A840E405_9BACT|nr:hypothetical protein [Neolewinella aquimaris]MBB4078395.1 hypothetical protein [Neolewinella aquimaris]